jgi:predicted nuclease of predicted toxin-antitoxin system
MKIFVDENIPMMTVDALQKQGHDVLDFRGTAQEGVDDLVLWEVIQRDRRMLITTDKGFEHHRIEKHYGILIVRLRQPNRLRIHQRVMHAMTQFKAAEWPGQLVMMRDRAQSVWRRQ